MTEIKAFLEGQDSSRPGALDNAVSQILVELRAHNYEAWKWRFEDSFGVELDTVLKVSSFVSLMSFAYGSVCFPLDFVVTPLVGSTGRFCTFLKLNPSIWCTLRTKLKSDQN